MTTCYQDNMLSRKWFILAFYRPPKNENLHTFFNYISKCTEKALCKYENIVLLGDINIDTLKKKGSKVQLFNQFCETFDMTNLIKSNTCFTKSSESSIDIILTNRPRFFFHCQSVETGISDVHTMVCTLMGWVSMGGYYTVTLKRIWIAWKRWKLWKTNFRYVNLF